MRLVRLVVERFQCIESADIELGPGLNVLYGPNDLGKSSLAWAIRAVLLLQHGSAAHERFVSWYGGGEPRVQLTLIDDSQRYLRVTKVFASGTAGRSKLESSKDGRTYHDEASGRAVDDKLRVMLGWGLQRPGGAGPRGVPESFLTQVLLAEQDTVRKVLFESSLSDDPDESGRARLVAALGALAQDPVFKRVLDEAQGQVDLAFTPTGKRKRTADSPFKAIVDKLKEYQDQRDELEARVRDTTAAEARIRGLHDRRDEVQRGLDDDREALAVAERQLAARRQRDALDEQLQAALASIRSVEDLQRQIERAQQELTGLSATAEASVAELAAATAVADAGDAGRDASRQALDALTHEDIAAERDSRALDDDQKTAREAVHDAERGVERATEAHRAAREVARTLAEATAASLRVAGDARIRDEAANAAAAEAARAQQALDDARQRLRDAASGDRVQKRALQQKELENRRLVASGQRDSSERALRVADEIGAVAARATAAETARDEAAAQGVVARRAVDEAQAAVATVEAAATGLRALGVVGLLRDAEQAAAAGAEAAASAEADRARAVGLRAEEAALRATVRGDLPSAADIAVLRQLREDLRIAEARLGGGVSVTVVPRRPIELRVTVDGVAQEPAVTGEPRALSANGSLAVSVDDVVDIQIVAGEASARRTAAELRGRWVGDGGERLRAHGVDTLEQLEALRQAADAAASAADDRRRDAEQAEARAQRSAPDGDPGARVAELTAELAEIGDVPDRGELDARLARLGAGWQAALKAQAAELDRERELRRAELDRRRDQVTRLEAHHDGQRREAAALRAEARRREGELDGPWPEIAARQRAAVAAAELELVDLDRQRAALVDSSSGEEAAARAAVTTAEAALADATRRREQLGAEALAARDAATQAATRLDEARARARHIDVAGAWSAMIATPGDLPLASWHEAVTAAEATRDARRQAAEAVRDRIEQRSRARAAAIQDARDRYQAADARARDQRARCELARTRAGDARDAAHRAQAALAERRLELAGTSIDEARRTAARLRDELAALESQVGSIPGGDVAGEVAVLQARVTRQAAELRELEEDLARARGALEQVGGAIVRDKQRELDRALAQARDRHHQIEIEYDAWSLLVDTLRESESTEGAHLGRALAGPVSQRFRQLTGGRYGELELGAHLEATGIQVAGDRRSIGALSAGTQDQLATLLRLCIAEQLQSAIVLDDHLTHSDGARIDWFNTVLRTAAQQVQIILITCRPAEVLTPAELPRAGESVHAGAAGLLRAVDLSAVIHRFAASAPPRATAQRPG